MPRVPDPRTVARENRAFLRRLARTGNAHEAARALGLSRTRFTKRRAADPAFATRWDQALSLADAGLGARAEARPVRLPSGRLQLRRTPPRALDAAAEQRFLLSLSATANVRLSAAAAGFSHSAFCHRKRDCPAFAREWQAALKQGYERIEAALLATLEPGSHAQDEWRDNDPPPLPRMTVNQALQLMYLHQKEAMGHTDPPHTRRRRGESPEAWSYRLAALAEARAQRDREAFALAEAERRAAGTPWLDDAELERMGITLPDLEQVTGWSRADPAKAAHHPDTALFGGWRIGDMKRTRKRTGT